MLTFAPARATILYQRSYSPTSSQSAAKMVQFTIVEKVCDISAASVHNYDLIFTLYPKCTTYTMSHIIRRPGSFGGEKFSLITFKDKN